MTSERTRRWIRYFAEFAVVFLGVSLSFVAEDLRENRRDRHAERASLIRYIVSSPSLWWDDGVILRLEDAFARGGLIPVERYARVKRRGREANSIAPGLENSHCSEPGWSN